MSSQSSRRLRRLSNRFTINISHTVLSTTSSRVAYTISFLPLTVIGPSDGVIDNAI